MLPTLFTSRYLAEDVLASGEVVPVRVSYEAPIVPLAYPLEETAELLVPEFAMLGEWHHLCQSYRRKLDMLGVERIGKELREISDRHGGRGLVLLDYEDLTRGLRNHRIIFGQWWEERTGRRVYELTNDGARWHYSEMPRQVQPKLPKAERDQRYRASGTLSWPLTHRQVKEWSASRYWQQARSKSNPHAYTVRHWNDERAFELVVLHIREHGYETVFGGAMYTQYDCGDHFYWTQGHALAITKVINRKWLPGSEDVGNQVPAPGLFDIDTKEEA